MLIHILMNISDTSQEWYPRFYHDILKLRPIMYRINSKNPYADRGVTIQSKRLIEEMKVFIWKNGRAEAQSGIQ
jgi:hypothetical protein